MVAVARILNFIRTHIAAKNTTYTAQQLRQTKAYDGLCMQHAVLFTAWLWLRLNVRQSIVGVRIHTACAIELRAKIYYSMHLIDSMLHMRSNDLIFFQFMHKFSFPPIFYVCVHVMLCMFEHLNGMVRGNLSWYRTYYVDVCRCHSRAKNQINKFNMLHSSIKLLCNIDSVFW